MVFALAVDILAVTLEREWGFAVSGHEGVESVELFFGERVE